MVSYNYTRGEREMSWRQICRRRLGSTRVRKSDMCTLHAKTPTHRLIHIARPHTTPHRQRPTKRGRFEGRSEGRQRGGGQGDVQGLYGQGWAIMSSLLADPAFGGHPSRPPTPVTLDVDLAEATRLQLLHVATPRWLVLGNTTPGMANNVFVQRASGRDSGQNRRGGGDQEKTKPHRRA